MAIHDDDVAKVRDTTDLVALVGEHANIKRAGRNWVARCPFHGERTPSFSVSAEKGVYYCFGCQRSGDAFTFIQEVENLDFAGAVEALAARKGMTLRYTSREETKIRSRRAALLDAVARAVDFYHQQLRSGKDSAEARRYLRSRGYDKAIIKKYQIGWAPSGWDELAKHLKLRRDEFRDSGLGFVNKASLAQDFFRSRIMFPIADERGRFVGFGGRELPGGEGPKYKNTSGQTKFYNKSRLLYGLDLHRAGIVAAGEAIICEGYTDVIGFGMAGMARAVATCGTALTEQHIELLKRYSADRLLLAFDADSAGFAAAERVYEWEQRFELDVRVVELPAGVDPGDLAQKEPQLLSKAVKNAIPFLGFRVARAMADLDPASVESRGRAAERAVAVVCEHPNEAVRDEYFQKIADHCMVNIKPLRDLATRMLRSNSGPASRGSTGSRGSNAWGSQSTGAPQTTGAPQSRGSSQSRGASLSLVDEGATAAQDEALRLIVSHPQFAPRLHANLFANSVRQEAFQALREHGFSEALSQCGQEAANLLRRCEVEGFDADSDDVLAGLARSAGRRTMEGLERELRQATKDEKLKLSPVLSWLKLTLEALDVQESRVGVLAELLPWLIRKAHWRTR